MASKKGLTVYITGSPGTGKTSVASRLKEKIGGEHFELSAICLERGFIVGYDKRRKTRIVDLARLEKYLGRVLRGKEKFILSSHFIVKLPKTLKPKIFVLRCHPSTLAKRLKMKGFHREKIFENVWAEILDFCLQEALKVYGLRQVHEIDTTNKDVGRVVEEIIAVVKGKKKPKIGVCDWIKKLEEEGKLKEFLGWGERF